MRNFVARKKYFVQTSFCRRATLSQCYSLARDESCPSVMLTHQRQRQLPHALNQKKVASMTRVWTARYAYPGVGVGALAGKKKGHSRRKHYKKYFKNVISEIFGGSHRGYFIKISHNGKIQKRDCLHDSLWCRGATRDSLGDSLQIPGFLPC